MSKRPQRSAWARVKEALIEAGYKGVQSDVEKLIGIAQSSVSEWNRVGVTPGLENAITLGLKLNVCVEWILTERGPKRPGPPPDPLAQELWSAWPRIPQEERPIVVGFALGRALPITGSTVRRGK